MGTYQKGINYLLGELALASTTLSKDIKDKKTAKVKEHTEELENEVKNNGVSMSEAKAKTQEVINQKYEQKVQRKKKMDILQKRAQENQAKKLIENRTMKEMKPYA